MLLLLPYQICRRYTSLYCFKRMDLPTVFILILRIVQPNIFFLFVIFCCYSFIVGGNISFKRCGYWTRKRRQFIGKMDFSYGSSTLMYITVDMLSEIRAHSTKNWYFFTVFVLYFSLWHNIEIEIMSITPHETNNSNNNNKNTDRMDHHDKHTADKRNCNLLVRKLLYRYHILTGIYALLIEYYYWEKAKKKCIRNFRMDWFL